MIQVDRTSQDRNSGRKSLAIIGSYPPPQGGVTTHILRLRDLLDRADVDYMIYNTVSASSDGDRVVSVRSFRLLWMLWYIFFGKVPCVYVVSQRLLGWLAAAAMQQWHGRTVAIRLQNAKLLEYVRIGGWRRTLSRYALCRVSAVVCVNQELVAAMQSIGVDRRRIHMFPGFLPPVVSERDSAQVSPEVWRFSRARSPLVVANGKVATWRGEDLYGLDLLVCLAERLKGEFPDLGIVVCFWDHPAKDQARLEQLIALAKAKGVEQNIFFNTAAGPFLPVLERADLLVRPTITDGDANSVREALYCGVPVVASDVVERPPGTITFTTRDIDDFAEKVRQALCRKEQKPFPSASGERESAHERARAYLAFLSGLQGSVNQVSQMPSATAEVMQQP